MLRFTWIPLVLVLTAAGCAAPPTPTDPPTAAETELVVETEVSIPLPTVPPVTPLPVNVPPNMPAGFTPNELAAAVAPADSVYSGYQCSITTESCTCDNPTIVRVTFTFQPGNLLTYTFASDYYGSTWEMARIGPDQWTHTIKIGAGETGANGSEFYLMTMQPNGFKFTQRRDADGKSVTCPDAVFTRMGN